MKMNDANSTPPGLSRAQRRMLRLLGSGWLLVTAQSGVWFYTTAGAVARSRLPVIMQMLRDNLVRKRRGMGGDIEQFELTETGRMRAERLLSRAGPEKR